MSSDESAVMHLRGAEMPPGGPEATRPGTGSGKDAPNAPAASERVLAPCPMCGATPALSSGDAGGGLWRAELRCATYREAHVAFGRDARAAEAAVRAAWNDFVARVSR